MPRHFLFRYVVFLPLKRCSHSLSGGVTQTEGAGVTQTDLCGVTHTDFVVYGAPLMGYLSLGL